MSLEVNNDESMLKIVMCEEDDLIESPGSFKKFEERDVRSKSSGLTGIRKQNGTRSANYVLTGNPYQKKGVTCSNCQSMHNAKNNVSPFTQKIMSAKLLRFKQMQNQISEMTLKINELTAENRILKTLQRRQDNALKKYEGSKEQLPQLIRSHNEEVRVINQKFKQLRVAHKDLESKLKQRDSELMNLREQHSHLLALSRDKDLFDRDKLSKKLAAIEHYSKEQAEKIVTLQRKLELQEKNFKHQLHVETQKHKETQSQLLSVRQINSSLRMKEGKEKSLSSPRKRFDLNNADGCGNRSRASLPSPQRLVVIEGQRTTTSETSTKSTYSSASFKNEEELESTHEEEPNIKVSVKRSNITRRPTTRGQPALCNVRVSTASSQVPLSPSNADVGSTANQGALSLKEDAEHKASDLLLNGMIGTADIPRYQFRSGISIPSDLTIGNAMRMRAAAEIPSSTDESDGSEDDDRSDARARNPLSSNGNDRPSSEETNRDVTSLRARTEEDIDKIIDKACDDMMSTQLDHDKIINGLENVSLMEELTQLRDLSWDELHQQIQPMKEEITKKIERNLPDTDYSLDAHEKNHLLKALNLIDEEEKPDTLDKLLENGYAPTIQPDRPRQSVRQMFANRKKIDLMKSLFGSDTDPIFVNDGTN